MPTGYTAKLMETGVDFRTFVLTCARGMGACVMQRDDPIDEPPKRQEPSDYSSNAAKEAEATLARLRAMTPTEQRQHGAAMRKKVVKQALERMEEAKAENERLDAMVSQVEAWVPPTDEHKGLRDFMLEQLRISRNDTAYSERSLADAQRKTPEAYFVDAISSAVRNIDYYKLQALEENVRTYDRNQWIDKLYASLP